LKLPTWFQINKIYIKKSTLKEDIKEYQIMHDCGKPYCITIDEDGRRHFPDMQTYQEIHSLKFLIIIVADLISKDMVFHTIKSDEVEEF
jgi:hypothetical protein